MSSQYNIDYNVVKKPHQDEELTEEEVARWLYLRDNPFAFFTEECWVVGARGKQLFEPRDYQIDMLEEVLKNRYMVINAPRQSGKSTLLTLLALHSAIFFPDVTVGLSSYRMSGCKDLLNRIKYTFESLPSYLKPPVTLYNQSEIRFTNGGTIFVQVTSNQVFRGRSFGDGSLAVFDEFAHVDLETAEAAYEAAMPALEGGGDHSTSKVVIISTPNGTGSNKYAQLAFGAMEGSNNWRYHKVDPMRIPNRDEAWRKKKIRDYGLTRFKQEFMGEFISSKPLLISSITLEQIAIKQPIKQSEDLRFYVDSFRGRDLAVGVDVAEGVGLDSSTIQVVDINTMEQVAEYENNTASQNEFTRDLFRLLRHMKNDECGELFLGVEKNAVGQGVLRLIENSQDTILDCVTMINDVDEHGVSKGRSGLTTSVRTKGTACALLKEMVENGSLKLASVTLINQLRLFMKQGSSFRAEKGGHDDLVSAFLIVMMMLPQIANYDDNVDSLINEFSGVNESDEFWGISF